MIKTDSTWVTDFMSRLEAVTPHEAAFHQAVGEVVPSLEPVLERNPVWRDGRILERLVEPERVIEFRVSWVDDAGVVPYKSRYGIRKGSLSCPT